MYRTTVAGAHLRVLWLYALSLVIVPVCKAQFMVEPCSSNSFSQHAPVSRRNYTFATSVATFCPSSSLSGTGDFRSWVFIPEGGSEMDTNGTYYFEDPLARGFSGSVCVFNDAGKTLLTINLASISLDPPGELFFNFTSRAGQRSDITVRYGPGGFSTLVNEAVLDLGTEDTLPFLWNSTGLTPNRVLLCLQGALGLEELPGLPGLPDFRPDSETLRQQCSDVDPQRPPTEYMVLVRMGATPELGVYTFVLRWPREESCVCSCGECGCPSNQSMPVTIRVNNSNPTTETPTMSSASPSPSPGASGLGPGGIVGIAIGVVVAVVVVLGGVCLYCCWRTRKKGPKSDHESQSPTNSYHTPTGRRQDFPMGPVGPDSKPVMSAPGRGIEEPDYVRLPDPSRTIAIVADKQIEKDWLEDFKTQLGHRHGAEVTTPSFTNARLLSELPSLLQNEHCEFLYLLWMGSLEQQHQNGTNGSSHLPIWHIAQESLFQDNSEKLVWVQFGVSSSSSRLHLASDIQVVNFEHVPGDGEVSGEMCADEVFKSVEPRLKELAALDERLNRTVNSEVTSSNRPNKEHTEELRILHGLVQGQMGMQEILSNMDERQKRGADTIGDIKDAVIEDLETTRRVEENQQEMTYADHSPAKLTTS